MRMTCEKLTPNFRLMHSRSLRSSGVGLIVNGGGATSFFFDAMHDILPCHAQHVKTYFE